MVGDIILKQFLTLFLFFGIFWSGQGESHGLPSFTGLIERASPAVVKIDTVQAETHQTTPSMPQSEAPETFQDLFEHRRNQPDLARSTGSGFVISSDGHVLTNYHVVVGASEIVVRLIDRREFDAEVIGVDSRSDLALLKIDSTDLPFLKFAMPGKLKVGEWVLAIGSPFDLDYSASAGIVSAIGRSIPTAKGENYVPFVQSDVAINPGNSGGPLLNLDGEVIGVNSQIFTRSGGSMGVSFSIPSSVALEVVGQLMAKGSVDRGWLGVFIQNVDKDLARSLGLVDPSGALVAQVEPGSPADKAGILAGDVIISFDGQNILHSTDLPHIVGLIAPGKKVIATIIREGEAMNMNIVIGTLPGAKAMTNAILENGVDKLGLEVSAVDRSRVGRWRGGVVVETVSLDSPAFHAGVKKGDIIIQIGYNSIDNLAEYRESLKAIPVGVLVPIRFIREGLSLNTSIKIEN